MFQGITSVLGSFQSFFASYSSLKSESAKPGGWLQDVLDPELGGCGFHEGVDPVLGGCGFHEGVDPVPGGGWFHDGLDPDPGGILPDPTGAW